MSSFWRVLASSSRGLGGRSCAVVPWAIFGEACLVEACLLEGRFEEAGFWGPSGVPWGLLGLPGAFWGFLGLAGASSWGLLGSWGFVGLLGVSWGFRAGSRRVSCGFLGHRGASWSLWLAFVSSSRSFWRVPASRCRPFGGCSHPVIVAWAGARVRSSFRRASWRQASWRHASRKEASWKRVS